MRGTTGKPYDATARTLIGTRPKDWLRFLNLPVVEPITLLDTDVSVVTAATDGLLQVGDKKPFGVHFEFETGHHGAKLPSRLCAYNSQASEKTGLVFWSVLVLLDKGADSPSLTGILERRLPGADNRAVCTFRYEVLRVWQIAPERFLNAGFGLLPLAPTGNVTETDAPQLIETMADTVENAVADSRLTDLEAGDLWYATYILMSAKYGNELSKLLLRKVNRMRESPAFQAILEEGREEGRDEGIVYGRYMGVRDVVLRIGAKRFGIPSAQIVARIEAVPTLVGLEVLEDRLLAVETWDELLTGI